MAGIAPSAWPAQLRRAPWRPPAAALATAVEQARHAAAGADACVGRSRARPGGAAMCVRHAGHTASSPALRLHRSDALG